MKKQTLAKHLFAVFLSLFITTSSFSQILVDSLNTKLVNAKQGSIVELPGFISEKNIPMINYDKLVLPGPQFIISDDPEYIRFPEGVALKEAVQPGSVRLYLYNVNGVKDPSQMDRKITAVIKNTGSGTMHLRMLKYSSQKPGGNYLLMGKQGLADYFSSVPENNTRNIAPGMSIAIDEKMEKNIMKYNDLAHGIYDFVIDQPGEVNIIQTDVKTSGPNALARIKGVLPTRGINAGRGLFGISNYKIMIPEVLDTRAGAAQIVVADGVKDPWVIGMDNTLNKVSRLEGNYGVMYDIELKWKSTDGKGLALVIWNSRGSKTMCNGMSASMVVSKGKFDEGIIKLPSDRLLTHYGPETILVQVFPPGKIGEEQTIKLKYSPPGASCLPTPLVFIPVNLN